MFAGWPHVPAADRDALRLALMRNRVPNMKLEKPVLQVQFPRCLAVDPWTNSKLLVVADATVSVLDIETDVCDSKNVNQRYTDAAWYPFDSALFVTGTTENINLWDASRLVAKRTIKLMTRCNQVAFSPFPSMATTLAIASSHGEVRLADLRASGSASTLPSRSDSSLTCLSWSPRDSHTLVTGGADSRVLIWDVRRPAGFLYSLDEFSSEYSSRAEWEEFHRTQNRSNPSRNATAHGRASVTSVTFLKDGRHILSTATNGATHLWRESSTPSSFYHTHVNFERRVAEQWGSLGFHAALADDLDIVFTSSAAMDNSIDCMDVLTGKEIVSLNAHVFKVRCLAFRNHSDVELFSAADDGFVLKWSCPRIQTQVADEDNWD